jgi:hypothetical protein
MRALLWLLLSAVMLGTLACNTAKDTAKTADKGGQNAIGIAEKMKGGTVGNADESTGEASGTSEGGE